MTGPDSEYASRHITDSDSFLRSPGGLRFYSRFLCGIDIGGEKDAVFFSAQLPGMPVTGSPAMAFSFSSSCHCSFSYYDSLVMDSSKSLS